ncbi:MAG: hypothetical protein IJY56_01875 [Clostridia bacterium]|nr:hypothetical protein [Clostridia bacterium]
MKKLALCLVCLIILCATACKADNSHPDLRSGTYYMSGYFESGSRPYITLSLEDDTFRMGEGQILSFSEFGSFEIAENNLIVKARFTTFTFEIKDSKTLILIDNGNGETFDFAENSEFIFSNDII